MTSLRAAAALAALALVAACPTETLVQIDDCVVDIALQDDAAFVGQIVTLSGGPFSEDYDTTVRVGGISARVVEVSRDGCEPCDACRLDADCEACFACPECEASCDTCVETVRFVVPDGLAPGTQGVVLFNRHGGSLPVPLEVLTPTDTDTALVDTGPPDDSPDETGAPDTDAPDTDAPDTDAPDTDTDAPDTDTDSVP